MLPEDLIYDEFKRQREGQWQPEALELPLYVPTHEPRRQRDEEDEEVTDRRGVIIIDMNDGVDIAL
jgi:hypothetical protein